MEVHTPELGSLDPKTLDKVRSMLLTDEELQWTEYPAATYVQGADSTDTDWRGLLSTEGGGCAHFRSVRRTKDPPKPRYVPNFHAGAGVVSGTLTRIPNDRGEHFQLTFSSVT